MYIILIPGFPKDANDTTCLPAFQQFVLSLISLYPGQKFTIIAFQYPFARRQYTWHGVSVVPLGGRNRAGVFRLLVWLRAYFVLLRISRHTNITGLFSIWLTECALVANFFSRLKKIKHFMWIIGQDALASNRYIRRIKPKASQVIAMSDFIREEFLRNHGIHPFLVAENGITPGIFPGLNTLNREIDILGTGSLIPLKKYTLFVEIIYEIKKTHPQIKVVIAGDGPERDNLKQLSAEMGLTQTIQFPGSIPHSAALDLMNKSKIFLHTSGYEGNSTVLMEALYSGCKVISTQGLANKNIKNLYVRNGKDDLVSAVKESLEEKSLPERVLFNSMDSTAERIMKLFAD